MVKVSLATVSLTHDLSISKSTFSALIPSQARKISPSSRSYCVIGLSYSLYTKIDGVNPYLTEIVKNLLNARVSDMTATAELSYGSSSSVVK